MFLDSLYTGTLLRRERALPYTAVGSLTVPVPTLGIILFFFKSYLPGKK